MRAHRDILKLNAAVSRHLTFSSSLFLLLHLRLEFPLPSSFRIPPRPGSGFFIPSRLEFSLHPCL